MGEVHKALNFDTREDGEIACGRAGQACGGLFCVVLYIGEHNTEGGTDKGWKETGELPAVLFSSSFRL